MPNGNERTDIERQLALGTCHHETSHAVVAWRVGEMAGFIQLGAVHGGEGDFGGMSWIPPIYDFDPVGTIKTVLLPGKKDERVPKLSYKSALIAYAGRAGHNKYLSEVVGHKVSAAPGHFVGDMRQVRQVTTDRKLMAKYRKQAGQMVERDWTMIQKLAFALFERKRMERAEIEDLLSISIGSGGQTKYDFRGLASPRRKFPPGAAASPSTSKICWRKSCSKRSSIQSIPISIWMKSRASTTRNSTFPWPTSRRSKAT